MIYIIITVSIQTKFNIPYEDHRINRYQKCIQSVLDLFEKDPDIKIIIVENNGLRSTFLDKFQCDVVYTENNKIETPNKGVIELMDVKDVIKRYDINDDDIIVKLTGRYKVFNTRFIETIKEYEEDYDAFVKFFNVCTLQYLEHDCVLGMYGIKCKYLKEFEYESKKSAEIEFATFVRNRLSTKLCEIQELGLECCFADNLRILNV